MNISFFRMAWLALPSLIFSACALNHPTAHEQALGQSVRQARVQQSVHPAGTPSERGPLNTDGVVAAYGVDRYHQSFARPQAPMSVLNILASPGAGAAAMPSGPVAPR